VSLKIEDDKGLYPLFYLIDNKMDLQDNLNRDNSKKSENVKEENTKEFKELQQQMKMLEYEVGVQKEVIKKLAYRLQSHPPFPWMDMAETMQTLNIAERTVHSHIEKGILGRSWLGGKLYFNRKEIEDYLETNYKKRIMGS
jgi:hypothetical protein